MKSARQAQMHLRLEADSPWEQLPTSVKETTIDLLSQLLKTVLTTERTEETSDERKVDRRPS